MQCNAFYIVLFYKVNGKDHYVCGIYSYNEAENSLVLNTIPWEKAPTEWMYRPGFAGYINRKKNDHDSWLDNRVE